MLTKSEAFKRAFDIKQNSVFKRKAAYDAEIDKLYKTDDRFRQLENSLKTIGARLAITAISGDLEALEELRLEAEKLNGEKQKKLEEAGIGKYCCECAKCGDTGYIGGKICDCVRRLAKELTVSEMSKSLPIESCTFESFSLDYYSPDATEKGVSPRKRMTKLLKLCKEYVIKFNPEKSESLLFMGSAGLGKTHLSLAIVSELTDKGYNVIYGSAYNLFSAMESEHFNSRSDDTYNSAISCDLLVIDDLGSEFVSPYIQTLLYNIINTRLLASRPTIISTNLGMAEIENRYTPRVSSRLVGCYNASKLLGNDIRQIKMMQKQ